MATKSSFPPSVGPDCRVLILGSLPGERSLAAQQYYANPTNQFWRLVGDVIGRDLVVQPYAKRLASLIDAGIGLWDVIKSARRQGSLDTAIRDHEKNDLRSFAATLPKLKCVAFNGGKSSAIGRKQVGADAPFALVTLPSSSAAYCSISLAQKQAEWRTLRAFLPISSTE